MAKTARSGRKWRGGVNAGAPGRPSTKAGSPFETPEALCHSANGGAGGDSLLFTAYGPGAVFGQIDATRWMVTSGDGLTSEIITFVNAPNIDVTDFLFA